MSEQKKTETQDSADEVQRLREEISSKTEAFQATVEILKSGKAQLENELSQLRAERDRLAAEAATLRAQAEKSRSDERMENAFLRESISEIAAEVARLAINLEGADSPIERALSSGAPSGVGEEGNTRISLAQRIRNLQDRAR